MKLNKKGFTLIELLAVVVILLAISVLAISSINSAIERNKAKQNDSKKRVIESYAELYYEEHKNSMNDKCVDMGMLYSYLSDSEKVDADGNIFTGSVKYDLTTNKWFYQNSSC